MQRVESPEWLGVVESALVDGFTTFVTLMGIDDNGVQLWLRLADSGGAHRVFAVDASVAVPTLVGLLPDADWPEREAAEMFGIEFTGREMPPLLRGAASAPVMRKSELLDARQVTPWPGEKDPGGTTPRRRTLPPGVAGGAR